MVEERGAVDGQVTQNALKLLKALRTLGLNPGSQNDMSRMLYLLVGVKQEHEEVPPSPSSTHGETRSFHYPKISIFYGEESKGEVNWETYRSEVLWHLRDGMFTKEQILMGVRRSLKGSAAEKLRSLGTRCTVEELLKKLDCDYGSTDTRQNITKKF